MKVIKFTFNPFQENTYLLVADNNDAIVVDPGMFTPEEHKIFDDYILDNNINLIKIVNTHGHIDHVFGVFDVKEKYNIPFYMHKEDEFLLERAFAQAEMFGIPMKQHVPLPDEHIKEGDEVTFGNVSLDVIEAPGHSPGHVVLYNKDTNSLINGDVLFDGSYGRVDLPGGEYNTLKNSITNKLFQLPDETVVYTGHGGETTIGKEKVTNPILM